MNSPDDPERGAPPGPLAGLRILELGGGQPGAYAGWLLSELGADVVVLVLREERDSPPSKASPSADELALHAGKRRLLLAASRPEGREVAVRLARYCDAVVSSLPPRTAERLSLDAQAVRQASPGIVYAQATAAGAIGGSQDEPMADIVGQAAGGLMWKTGIAGSPPTAAGAALGDHGAGAYLGAAILGGLAQAALTGRGTRVDISLAGSQIALQSWEIGTESVFGRDSGRAGLGHPEVSPGAIWGTFEARDGAIALGSVDARRFERLCGLMDLGDLFARYSDDARRSAGIPEITERLRTRFLERDCAHWLDLFAEHDIMGTRVHGYDDVIADEQAWANGYLRTLAPSGITVAGAPIQLDGGGATMVQRHAPWNEDGGLPLLAELGYTPDEIAALRTAGVVGGGPA